MADGQLIIDIQANTENVEKGLSKVNKSIETTEQTAKNASGGVGGLGGALGGLINPVGLAVAGIGGLGAGILAATKAASDEQVGIDRLGTTLAANIPNFKGNEDAAEGFVSKMEGLAFSDDAARDSLNKLVPRTHDLAEAQKLSTIAADLARAKNIDLATATDIVGKVYGGNVGVLGRYGIEVAKGSTATEALSAIQKMAGGQAEQYANSAAGAGDRIKVSLGDTLETIGHAILPAASLALGKFADVLSSPGFQAAIQGIADLLVNGLGAALDAIGKAIAVVQPIIQPFFDAFIGFFSDLSKVDLGTAVANWFNNMSNAVSGAWGSIAPALGTLLSNVISWIGDHGPTILQKLGEWAKAFGDWVVTKAIPWLGTTLGLLLDSVWTWIGAHGPTILQKLGEWAKNFGDWVVQQAIPWLTQNLTTLINGVLDWIQQNGPGILAKLSEWATAFGTWVTDTALPWLLQTLGALLNNVLQWIGDNAPGILAKLAEWANAFVNWVLNDALPWLLPKLGDLLGKVIEWIGTNGPAIMTQLGIWAKAFSDWVMSYAWPKLQPELNKFLASLGKWIQDTGPQIGKMLSDYWNAPVATWPGFAAKGLSDGLGQLWLTVAHWISKGAKDLGDAITEQWIPALLKAIGDLASAAGNKAVQLGQDIVLGIMKGIGDAWGKFTSWFTYQIQSLIDAAKQAIGAHSPSQVMADEVGAPLAQGIGVGFANAWPDVQSGILGKMADLAKQAQQTAGNPAYAPGSPAAGLPAYQPQNPAYLPGGGQTGGNPAYLPGEPAYRNPAYDPQNPAYLPGGRQTGGNPAYAPPGDHAGSGGQGARAFSSGFGSTVQPGTSGNVTLYLSIDGGPWMTPQQASQKLSVRTRLTEVRT